MIISFKLVCWAWSYKFYTSCLLHSLTLKNLFMKDDNSRPGEHALNSPIDDHVGLNNERGRTRIRPMIDSIPRSFINPFQYSRHYCHVHLPCITFSLLIKSNQLVVQLFIKSLPIPCHCLFAPLKGNKNAGKKGYWEIKMQLKESRQWRSGCARNFWINNSLCRRPPLCHFEGRYYRFYMP